MSGISKQNPSTERPAGGGGFGTAGGFSAGDNANVPVTRSIGRPGFANYAGFLVVNEKNNELLGRERYRTFSDMLANLNIVAASLRYFVALAASVEWQFVPAEGDADGQFAERAEKILTDDPLTPWYRIVRRTSMFRFYGFSLQEWTARRADDGSLTILDVAPRPQVTIERWDTTIDGTILGIVQRDPQNQSEIYIPRTRLVHAVDDSIDDRPDGLGLFRHIVQSAKRLARYEQLEGFGFETDLRGIPVGRVPYAELRARVEAGDMSAADARTAVASVETFIRKHIKNPELGLVLDSSVYRSIDETAAPSATPLFGVDLLSTSSTGLPEIHTAIERLNREIARIMGTEHLLLGSDSTGSFALARDKSNQLAMNVNGVLKELGDVYERDLLGPIWRLNGWPDDMMPKIRAADVQFRDIEQVTAALRDLALAGAPLDPDDPAINDVRGLIGVAMADTTMFEADSSLMSDRQPALTEDEITGDLQRGSQE